VTRNAPLTVERAAVAYLGNLEARNQRIANDARLRLNRLFLPRFGATHIADLTRTALEAWRDGLVRVGGDAEQRRRSQDTVNRVLSIVKALLNHAVGDPANALSNDSAWRLVRPFQRVGRAREVHFESAEVLRLLEESEDAAFRDLLTAGFLTGARYGELAACQVRHFDRESEALIDIRENFPRFPCVLFVEVAQLQACLELREATTPDSHGGRTSSCRHPFG